MEQYSPDEIRRILLEHKYCLKADDIAKKWGVSRARLREWKHAYRYEYLSPGLSDLIIAALWQHGPSSTKYLAEYTAWQDRSFYTAQEIVEALQPLLVEGVVKLESGKWVFDEAYLHQGRPFIFPASTLQGHAKRK